MERWRAAILAWLQSPGCRLGIVTAYHWKPVSLVGEMTLSTPLLSPVPVLLPEGFWMLHIPDLCAWLRAIMSFVGGERSQPFSLASFSARFKWQ